MEMDRLQKEMEKKDKQEEVGQVQDEKMMVQDGLEEMDNHEEVEKMYKWEEMGHDQDQELVVQEELEVMENQEELEDCRNNVIKLPKGKIGVFNGLEGYIVADSDDVLLVCKKNDDSSLIRKYASEIGLKYGDGFV